MASRETSIDFKIALLIIISMFCLGMANSIEFNYPAVFNFGDSNSDTGDLVAGMGIQLASPNGQNYFKTPSGRFCDGRLMLDFLSTFLFISSH